MAYLIHHGILGQRWGVRRFQNKDGSYTAKGKERYSENKKSNGFRLTEKQKTNLKVGAAVTAGLLVAIGATYAANKYDLVAKGRGIVSERFGGKHNEGPEPLRTYEGTRSFSEKLARCNPLYAHDDRASSNCYASVLAMEAQNRQMDATARLDHDFRGMTISEFIGIFKNARSDSILNMSDMSVGDLKTKSPRGIFDTQRQRGSHVKNEIESRISKSFPDGARGALFVPTYRASHWMYWQKENGRVEITDTQSNNSIDILYFLGGYKYHRNLPQASLTAFRFDDLDFETDPSKPNSIDKIITNYGSDASPMLTDRDKYGNGFVFHKDNDMAIKH